MNQGAIATRYARGLFELATEQSKTDAVGRDLEALAALIAGEGKLRDVVRSKSLGIAAKSDFMTRALGQAVDPLVTSFVLYTLKNRREELLERIIHQYGEMRDRAQGIVRVAATTATPLDDSQKAALEAKIGAELGKKPVVTYDTDPAIIGGMVLVYDNRKADMSVRRQLERIESEIKSN